MKDLLTHIFKFWDILLGFSMFLVMAFAPFVVFEGRPALTIVANWFTRDGLYWAGMVVLCVALSYAGFVRLSRFALTRDHPVMNYALNALVVVGPFAAILLKQPMIIPAVIGLHVLSHLRSPDVAGAPAALVHHGLQFTCLLYTSPSPRDRQKTRMPSSA